MSRNYYISGNVVRELEAQPVRREKRQNEQELEEIRRKKIRRNAARRNRERAMYMGLGQLCFLFACVSVSALTAFGYIQFQSQLSHNMSQISALESKVTDLKAKNDARYKRITTSVDLDYVKKVAIEELGMHYASEDQIIYYSVDKSNFMDQYLDIPK